MLIELVFGAVFNIFAILISVINIPPLDPKILSYVETGFEYVNNAVDILATYVDIPFLLVMLGLIIAVDIAVTIYKVVMWVVRKIPLLNIS